MKSFLLNLLVFLAIPVVLHVGLNVVLTSSFRSTLDRHDIILLGDSQTEHIELPGIYNHSVLGSPYFVHYELARRFIDQFAHKTVYISCSYHNLSNLYQNRLASEGLFPGWRTSMFDAVQKYNIINKRYPEIRPDDLQYQAFEIKNPYRLLNELYLSEHVPNSDRTVMHDTLAIDKTIYSHWEDPENKLSDTIQRTYLDKLIRLLQANDCEVVLLSMPLTRFYAANVPGEVKSELEDILRRHDIRHLDLGSELGISGEYQYFEDYGHLNRSGDSLVTAYFRDKELAMAGPR